MLRKILATAVAAAALGCCAPAMAATTLVHEDDGFTSGRGGGSSIVGVLSVDSAQTISGFGLDIDLWGDQSLTFEIHDAVDGSLLWQSGPKAFVDNGRGYKMSDAMSFTFQAGRLYGLTALGTAGGDYFVDWTPNDIGGFHFQTGNQNIFGGTYLTGRACCDVGTAVVLGGAAGVPEPAEWALMLTGFAGLGAMLRRARTSAALA